MPPIQPGILAAVPPLARYLGLTLRAGVSPAAITAALGAAAARLDGEHTVLGVGDATVCALGRRIDGLRCMPAEPGQGITMPSTPTDLWLWLRGDDRGALWHRARQLEDLLAPAFDAAQRIDAFRHGPGLDLTGYEDGTENPKGDAAVTAAAVSGRGDGLDGSSFVAVQQWLHDFAAFEAMDPQRQDHTIGRRRSDNGEIDDAPASAHVKRTAQESFDPEAFVLRRSMPWADGARAGLVFTAFATSFAPFEAQLHRMLGRDDGVRDALFDFTRPVSGAYFWCPPVRGGRIDLRALGV